MSKCLLTRLAIKGHFPGKRGGGKAAFPEAFHFSCLGGRWEREGGREGDGDRGRESHGKRPIKTQEGFCLCRALAAVPTFIDVTAQI